MTPIKEMLAPKGSKCRPGLMMNPKYITIHNTANTSPGAGAESHGRYLQGAGKNSPVSYHYVVDDKLIVRIIPDNEVAWHAGDGGSGTGNRHSLAIEICENPESNLLAATDNAAELAAMLMKRYGIPIANVAQHNRWSGKNCPRRIRAGEPYSWNTFLDRVRAAYGGQEAPSAGNNNEEDDDMKKYRVYDVIFASENRDKAVAQFKPLKAKAPNEYVLTNAGGDGKWRIGRVFMATENLDKALDNMTPDRILA